MSNKIPLKLLRLTPEARDGFILVDFPKNIAEAELLEEYQGGMNAFIHIEMPEKYGRMIESKKTTCQNCSKEYVLEDVW